VLALGVFDRFGEDEYEQIVHFSDRSTGLRAIVAIHSTRLGPALGGTRFHPYATEDDALVDTARCRSTPVGWRSSLVLDAGSAGARRWRFRRAGRRPRAASLRSGLVRTVATEWPNRAIDAKWAPSYVQGTIRTTGSGRGTQGRKAMADRNSPDALLTPAEVAQMFRVNPKTVTRWARAGKITAIRTLGGHRRFRRSEIEKFLAEAEHGAL
jgi:excisionase family DNA binding protein